MESPAEGNGSVPVGRIHTLPCYIQWNEEVTKNYVAGNRNYDDPKKESFSQGGKEKTMYWI